MGVSGISPTPVGLAAAAARAPVAADTPDATGRSTPARADGRSNDAPAARSTTDTVTLSKEALDQLAKLKARDQEVRQHEAAHMAAAGGLVTSGASYTYQKGPDGVRYAIGGEVGIDTSPGRTPQETIDRARQIQAAALAPADPSGQDLAVAARAQQMAQQARSELAQQSRADAAPGADRALRRAYGSDASGQNPSVSVFA